MIDGRLISLREKRFLDSLISTLLTKALGAPDISAGPRKAGMEKQRQGQKAGKGRRPPTVVLGTIGSDAHIVGASVLRYTLREAGLQVAFLGAMASQEEFIDAALETRADAILISSLYGMARLDCEGFRDKCTEAGLGHILLYIGGLLVTDPEEWEKTRQLFSDMGMDRVYPPGTRPEELIADLRNDLGLQPEA